MNELMEKYRLVFVSPIGQEVLADILTLTHFGCTLDSRNPEEAAVHNIGIKILMRMGIFSKDTKLDVIRALSAIVPGEKKV